MKIVHFDVDEQLEKYLDGSTVNYPFIPNNISRIKNSEQLEVITIKTKSVAEESALCKLSNLQLLITRTVGTDHIDLEYCEQNGIAVYNIPDYGSYNIAEHALTLILAGTRNLLQAYQQTQQGKFSYKDFLGTSLHGKTIGIIGTGKIGLELIKLLQPFQTKLLAFDVIKNQEASKKYGYKYLELDKLLSNSDIISLHIPLNQHTEHMLGERRLSMIKDDTILVNTSRGGVIDTQALIKHIDKFKAVCLDVLEEERKFNKDHLLLKYNNVIITPHIGFYTDNALKNIARETMRNIERFKQNDNTNRIV